MKTLDNTDYKILNFLQDDATISVKELAERIGLSFTATYERVKSLKHHGIIRKNVALINAELAGFEIMAYCNIVLKEQSNEKLREFEQKINAEPQVLEVVSVSGQYDYMIKVVARNIKDYNNFMTTVVANIPNIGQYHSNIVLSVIKNDTKFTF
ncbi:AsnC family transcriptional regulator [Chryseobacterium sp. 6424]|uniref:Lrp/AsnC family transcriptional regulator n=1 Tax=Chryseobacterium sp. 6424 TaxID=2039166 RepID=UPI000EFD9B21|nr:Lrp/AsnC family transcriptional regulator [Chryseobacterium sp. 6424]AYO57676.1 AsnC family transcriptional regulator [Chryseobacterium sp. 6424]